MSTIILTGGGTAGHCIPNIALLPYLKKTFDKIYYVGSENGMEKNIVSKTGIPYYEITTTKLKRSFSFDNLKIPFKLFKGISEAKKIIGKLNPDIIFSKGGFVSLPVVIAGNKCNIPVVSHESDLTVGLANKIASRYSVKVLTSFPETAKTLKNGLYSGAPIRSEFFSVNREKALKYFSFSGKKPILLVTGGSQGSESINRCVCSALDELLKTFDVIHLCGKGRFSAVKKEGYFQAEYLNCMEYALAVADVILSRAGSNTVFEILALKKPNVLIPLPKGVSRGDQILNAEYFAKKRLSTLLYHENLNKYSLVSAVKNTYKHRTSFYKALDEFPIKDGSPFIANFILNSL